MALNAATRYVRAAQRNDMRAPSISVLSSVPLRSNHANARSEALYSTGSVTIENTADMVIRAIPIQQSVVLCVVLIMMIPARSTHVAICDEKLTMGTRRERNLMGPYPVACYTACPHSWQATAAAAIERDE